MNHARRRMSEPGDKVKTRAFNHVNLMGFYSYFLIISTSEKRLVAHDASRQTGDASRTGASYEASETTLGCHLLTW